MKYTTIAKHQLVFDYMSQGDLFFMLIKGTVACKVPMTRNMVLLSELELNLFKKEFREDLIDIKEAENINNLMANLGGVLSSNVIQRYQIMI